MDITEVIIQNIKVNERLNILGEMIEGCPNG